MKYKKELSVLLIFLTFAWPVFNILDPSYTPTQVILTVIFAYLGMRLTYFVYSKNNQMTFKDYLIYNRYKFKNFHKYITFRTKTIEEIKSLNRKLNVSIFLRLF